MKLIEEGILIKDNLIVSDNYGIGTVKDLYEQDFKGEVLDYIHIYFTDMEMDYRGPLKNLRLRGINKPSIIRELFKKNITEDVRELISFNFNIQQSKMTNIANDGSVENIVFLLRYLSAKKKNSVNNSLCAYDDNLHKKCMTNLAAELSVGSKKDYKSCLDELKRLIKKNQIVIKVENEEFLDLDEDF